MFKRFSILSLKLFGWDTKILFNPHIKKCVIAVGPHTSGWDIVIGVLYRSVIEIPNARFLGKKELFAGPFGFIFKWLGGTPVDRNSNQNLVDQVISKFQSNENFILALSPEGTRKKVDKIRTGFYYIAKGSGVPIILAGFDFKNKTLILSEPFFPSENEKEDLQKILSFFAPITGKHPQNGMSHLYENA